MIGVGQHGSIGIVGFHKIINGSTASDITVINSTMNYDNTVVATYNDDNILIGKFNGVESSINVSDLTLSKFIKINTHDSNNGVTIKEIKIKPL